MTRRALSISPYLLDPEHFEVRERALQSLMKQWGENWWAHLLAVMAVMPIHWLRTIPRLAIPRQRVHEALAANILVVLLKCVDARQGAIENKIIIINVKRLGAQGSMKNIKKKIT
jgi:hypothetical protein